MPRVFEMCSLIHTSVLVLRPFQRTVQSSCGISVDKTDLKNSLQPTVAPFSLAIGILKIKHGSPRPVETKPSRSVLRVAQFYFLSFLSQITNDSVYIINRFGIWVTDQCWNTRSQQWPQWAVLNGALKGCTISPAVHLLSTV